MSPVRESDFESGPESKTTVGRQLNFGSEGGEAKVDGGESQDSGDEYEQVFVGGRSFWKKKEKQPRGSIAQAPLEILGSGAASSEADAWNVEKHSERHEELSVLIFGLGWLFFPVWWGGCCLLNEDHGKPWAATPLAKRLATGSVVLGVIFTLGALAVIALVIVAYFFPQVPTILAVS